MEPLEPTDELDDLRRERLFDSLLSAGDRWHLTLDTQAERAANADMSVAEDLALLARLRALQTGREETEFARARIARQLDELMRAEPLGAEAARPPDAREWMRTRMRALTAPPANEVAAARQRAERKETERRARRQIIVGIVTGRAATLVGALLLLACCALAGVSAAAAHALPESPLYAVKRAEETTLLTMSWGDSSRGQTLNLIANHRLVEAATEADLKRLPEARSLLSQFDSTFTELIALTRHAQALHEDTSALTGGIQATVASEQSIGAAASAHGETSFAKAVTTSAQSAMTQMQAAGISVSADPDHGHQNNGNGNGNGNNGNGNGNASATPGLTPTPKPTHAPHGGNGAAGAGQNGAGSPTTTSTATSTATSSPVGGP